MPCLMARALYLSRSEASFESRGIVSLLERIQAIVLMYIAALFFILFRQVFNAYLERHRETVLICYLAIRALLCSEGI